MSNPARDWLGQAGVDAAVLDLCPDYTALVFVAENLTPGPSDDRTDALLSKAEDSARSALAGRAPAELPQVAAWRRAYQAFGAKPQRTRPSVEALLRRLEPGLPRIDRITDIYNAVSVLHLLPLGGEDLGAYDGPARLVRATGAEPFDTVSNGEPAVDHPEPGEVVWRDDAGVTCRCWNWRQCVRTRITHSTVSAVFILDCLAEPGPGGLRAAGDDLAGYLADLHPRASMAWRQVPSPAASR